MSLTAQEMTAATAEKAAEGLMKVATSTPADKQDWKPLDKGRNVIDQVAECALINGIMAGVLKTHAWGGNGEDLWETAHAELNTLEKAGEKLRENTTLLAAAIRALPDDQLDIVVKLPWAETTVLGCAAMANWNMHYHDGQINYIQSLCG